MKLSQCSPELRQRIEAQIAYEDNARVKVSDAQPQQRQAALESHRKGEAQGSGRVALCFTLYRVRLLDPCAKYGSCKAIIDGLRYASCIQNDREEDITLQVLQVKVAHFKDEKTVVTIEYPEP